MRRKSVALVMAAATVLSLMAGSGVTALADEETVELTMWGGWAGDQIGQLEKQLEGFNNSQDKIHVTYMAQDSMEQKLLTAIASDEVPDIVLWDRFNTSVYAPKGALMALDDYVEKDSIDRRWPSARAVMWSWYPAAESWMPDGADRRICGSYHLPESG